MHAQEKDRLLVSIANRVADYRQGEIEPIDQEYILAWLHQFEEGDQCVVLRETEKLLRKTYIAREHAKGSITSLATYERLTGNTPQAFWESAGLLRLQESSQSQNDMLGLLGEVLEEKFGFVAGREDSVNRTYVYLDDVSCSGNQIKNDLLRWAEEQDVRDAAVHVITMVLYRGGQYFAEQQLSSVFRQRNIVCKFWAILRLENRRYYVQDAEVFWPTELPGNEYVNRWKSTFGEDDDYFCPRPPGGRGSTDLFSSEEARHIIEQAFLKKGAYIYSLPQNPAPSMRPLGYSRLRSPGLAPQSSRTGTALTTHRWCYGGATRMAVLR